MRCLAYVGPRRRLLRSLRLLVSLIVIYLATVPIGSAQETGSVVKGRVISAASGAPIVGADVFLRTTPGREIATKSDLEGKFQFGNLPANVYFVRVFAEGYRLIGDARRAEPSVRVDVPQNGAGIDVTLSLAPGGAILGRVYDESGAGIREVVVQAFEQTHDSYGSRTLRRVGDRVRTGENGEFVISGLVQGKYFLRVRRGSNSELGPEYPPVFYPGTTDPEMASTVVIPSSSAVVAVGIDFWRRDTATISGSIINEVDPDNREAIREFFLVPVKEGADLRVVNSSPRDSPWKSYRLEGILPGTYDLYAVFRPDDVGFYGRTRIEVGVDDQDNVNLVIRPGVSVSGRVTVGQVNASDAVTDAITTMELWLDPMHIVMMTPLLSPTIEPDGRFHIENVPDLDFSIARIDGLPPGTYAQSALLDGVDVLHQRFRIQRSAFLEVQLAGSGGHVTGGVLDDKRNPFKGEAVVGLIPYRRPGPNPWFSFRVGPTRTGQFSIDAVPPGEYLLLALEGVGNRTSLFNDRFMARHRSQAKRIVIEPDSVLRQDVVVIAVQ